MKQKPKTRKRQAHLHPKDWDRRGRVIAALSRRRMTVTELARQVDRSTGYISAIIWGVDRSFSVEFDIAQALGLTREELFGPVSEGAAA